MMEREMVYLGNRVALVTERIYDTVDREKFWRVTKFVYLYSSVESPPAMMFSPVVQRVSKDKSVATEAALSGRALTWDEIMTPPSPDAA